MGVKVFHCADIHLDSPFSLFTASEAERRRTEQLSAFTSAILFAKTQNADIFLISGDLFDGEYVTRDTGDMLVRQFESCPDCLFFIAPGNHDPFTPNSVYARLNFPPNVHIFKNEKERVHIPKLNTDVYGFGFTHRDCLSSPLTGYPQLNPDMINILVCHGDLNAPGSLNGPITEDEIAKSGFDYVALGHIHKGTGVLRAGGTYYAYPGCLEGRSFDETGSKGALFGEITKEKNGLNFYRFSKRNYEKLTVDLSDCRDKAAAVEKIRSAVKLLGEDTSLRLTLTGEIRDAFVITEYDIGKGPSYPSKIDITDKTFPAPDFTALEQDSSLRGIFYAMMKKRLEAAQPDSPEYNKILTALRYGLCAMEDRFPGSFGGDF